MGGDLTLVHPNLDMSGIRAKLIYGLAPILDLSQLGCLGPRRSPVHIHKYSLLPLLFSLGPAFSCCLIMFLWF